MVVGDRLVTRQQAPGGGGGTVSNDQPPLSQGQSLEEKSIPIKKECGDPLAIKNIYPLPQKVPSGFEVCLPLPNQWRGSRCPNRPFYSYPQTPFCSTFRRQHRLWKRRRSRTPRVWVGVRVCLCVCWGGGGWVGECIWCVHTHAHVSL